MTTLQLIIKGIYLAEIVAGNKKIETRDITPKNVKKYVTYIGDDYMEPRKYDTITFYAGYNKNRKIAVVEIKSAEIFIITDEAGKPIPHDYEGEEYVEAIIEYQLGEVLSHNYN